MTPLILPLYFGRIMCILQLQVWMDLGQAESALFRIRLLTQKGNRIKAKAHSHMGQLWVTGKFSDKIILLYSSPVKVYM